MQKLTCYACSWCIFLAGTATVLMGEESALPPPPLPGTTAGTVSASAPTLAPAPMPPRAAGTVSAPANHESVPVPDATLSGAPAGPTTAAASPALCPADGYRRPCPLHHEVNCCGVRPLGACVCAQICTQVHNGIAAQMVLYHYDFNDPDVGDPSKLTPYGLRHLGQLEKLLQAGNACPVMIEQTIGSPALDASRQMHVVTVLGEAGLTPQVVIADTPAGLRGDEALLVHRNMLQQAAAGGATFVHQSTGSTAGGGSSGSNGQ